MTYDKDEVKATTSTPVLGRDAQGIVSRAMPYYMCCPNYTCHFDQEPSSNVRYQGSLKRIGNANL